MNYNKQSSCILKISLWLLFGFSILGNDVYAITDTGPKTRTFSEKFKEFSKILYGIYSHKTTRNYLLSAVFLMLVGVGQAGVFSHQIYKHYFAKEKKVSTTPVAPASPRKNWLLFMLCLLLGLLLIAGVFYHRQKKHT